MTYLKFLVFFSFLLLSVPSQANEIAIDLSKIKPLSDIEKMPVEAFEAKTTLIDDMPYDDEFLSYQVRLPKGWQETTANLNVVNMAGDGAVARSVLGIVSRFVSPPKNYRRSRFSVEAVELIHEIDARNWFIHYILKSGLSLEQVGLENEGEVEALYVEVEGDSTYVVRVKAIINGPRMVLARYYTPVEFYNDDKILQAQVIDSFELTNKQDINIETLKVHGFLDQTYLSFPISWNLNAPRIRSIERMEAQLFHRKESGKMAGQINLFLSNKTLDTTRSQELNHYKDQFKIDGYKTKSLIEKIKTQYHPDTYFGVTEVYSMKPDNKNLVDYELWLSVLENENYFYIMSLFTPSRSDDFYTWARNAETYKLILGNLRLTDDTVDNFQFLNQ
jgi:hypothetical protein